MQAPPLVEATESGEEQTVLPVQVDNDIKVII